jgi:DNA-binding GntR family transcriptional regulator
MRSARASNDAKLLGPLRRLSLLSAPQAAAEAVRKAILAGGLKPGERLIEQKLAARLGIGQPTLREAFKELEYQGFVRKGAQRGTYVTHLNKGDFQKILEVRMVLEELAVAKAAPNITAQAEQELTELVARMGAAAQAFDLGSFHSIDMGFHRQLWALARNEYLANALELVAFRLFAFVLIQRRPESQNEFLAATEQHRTILAGLLSRDPRVARQAFVSSTQKFWWDHHGVAAGPSPSMFSSQMAAAPVG